MRRDALRLVSSAVSVSLVPLALRLPSSVLDSYMLRQGYLYKIAYWDIPRLAPSGLSSSLVTAVFPPPSSVLPSYMLGLLWLYCTKCLRALNQVFFPSLSSLFWTG